jgi:hypothetical protein
MKNYFKKISTTFAIVISIATSNLAAQTCGSHTYPTISLTSVPDPIDISSPNIDIIANSVNNGTFYIASDCNIVGNIDFTDAEILIEAGAKITVRNGGILKITGSHLFSCSKMWGGIFLERGSQLVIDGSALHDNSLLEDADIAIAFYCYWGGGTIGYDFSFIDFETTKALQVNNVIFNRNRVGIDFARALYSASLGGSLYSQLLQYSIWCYHLYQQ